MEQTELAGFDDGTRPADEAAAVADDDGVAELFDADSLRFPDAEGAVTVTVTQVDYTIAYRGDDEFPVVHVFGRREIEDGDPVLEHIEVYDFEPYFYAPIDEVDAQTVAEYDGLVDYRETDDEGDPFESIRGERLAKVVGRTPRDVGQVRDDFDHYEADILFPNRLLIDKGVKSGVRVPERRIDDGTIRVPHQEVHAVDANATPRVNTFDIEVDDRNGFPEDGEERIVCLTSHDSYDDQYVNWLHQSPEGVDGPAALEAYEPIEDDFEADVRVFEEEEAMLEAFVDYIEEETDPDILTGWNCLPADTELLMADGSDRQIRNVEVGDTVVGSSDQQPTVAEVTNKWESEAEIFEFELADSTSLRTSGDHRILVGDDDAVDWKDGRNVEPGDYVLKPRKLRVENETVPTLTDLTPLEVQRFAERFDVTTGTLHHPKTDIRTPERCRVAADTVGCNCVPVIRRAFGRIPEMTYNRPDETYRVPLPDGGLEYRRTRLNLDRELTEREAYLAGLVLTDGSISPEAGVRFYSTREELHEQFPGETDLEPDGNGCYKQNVLDYARAYAFNGLGVPFGDKNDGEVDLSTVSELPESHIATFMAGVIDGDGTVSSCVSVAAENRSIGRWYVKLFRRLGIYAEQRDTVVRVPGTEREIDRLRETVLPHMSHSKKSAQLAELEGNKSGRSENIPFALFEAERGSDERRIGRDEHRRGSALKRHETDLEEWKEYVFVEVTDVATTGTETTYDIETTTHNFVAEDCLVHNCDDFDAPYLLDRMEQLQDPGHDHDLDIDRLSRVNEVWRSDWNGPDIKGRVVFDLLRAYKSTQRTELESYRLDAVGEVELGVGKERYSGDIGDLWEQDPERLLEYNLRDVELCVELDRKQDIVAFFEEVASFVGCKLEDAPTAGDAVDMYVLHKAYGEFALPSKGTVESGEEFEGGAVFEPITGVRENVSVLDLKSLYPMCMWTTNASPETKVDPEEYDGDTYRTPTGQHFRTEPAGMMREMIDELLSEREEKKELRNSHDPGTEKYETYDRQQASVKVIMNSLYGVSGWDRFRLYDKDSAAAVTATGRKVISYTQETVNEFGYNVTYGDTDSIMISLSDISAKEAIENSFELEERINDSYDDFAREELDADQHRFQIEFEKLYRRFFQAGKKKRYAGHIVWKEGKDVDDIDITGFEYQRSDIAPITKEVQREVIEIIVHGEDIEDVKDYVHDVIADFEDGNVSLDDVGIPGGIGKKLDNYDTDTAQVRGAKYANLLLGTNFGSGSKPKRLYLEKVHPSLFREVEDEMGLDPAEDPLYGEFKRDPDVICFEYEDQIPEEFEVDWDKMLEKTLRGPIARILEALDVSWEEVKSGQEQTGLESFM
jgi:DNA polymerase I